MVSEPKEMIELWIHRLTRTLFLFHFGSGNFRFTFGRDEVTISLLLDLRR